MGINLRPFCHQNKVKTAVIPTIYSTLNFRLELLLVFKKIYISKLHRRSMDRQHRGSANIHSANTTSQFQSINAERAEGGDLLSIEDRTPPQGLLSLENKSCEIFVIHPPCFYFGKRADTSALWSTPFPVFQQLYIIGKTLLPV